MDEAFAMEDEVKKVIENALVKHVGKPVAVIGHRGIAGGCINNAQQLNTTDGVFFLKLNDAMRFPGMFEAEAKGLFRLRSTAAIRVPEVVVWGEQSGKSYIILEYIRPALRAKNFWENFGRAMAGLHKNSLPRFGLDHHNFIGLLPQYNHFHSDWLSFFQQERLERQVKLAYDAGLLSEKHLKRFQTLYKQLDGFFPDEPSALLHGDLWSGNFMTGDDGEVCIYDPAVYYGHREAELSFTQLFGGFDTRFYSAYHESFPLQPGFDNRKDIYNLYPLLVHVNLFGGGYVASVERILTGF